MLNSTQRSLRNHQHPIGSTALLLRSSRVQIDSVMTTGDREGRAWGCKSVYPDVVQDEFKFGLVLTQLVFSQAVRRLEGPLPCRYWRIPSSFSFVFP
jgi:hypothetical protein